MSPDEQALRVDTESPAFRLGCFEQRWRLMDIRWPHAQISISAKDAREFAFRFECTGFPEAPPTAGPWDSASDTPLRASSWPQSKGGRVGEVFRSDWKGGSALYLPCDRVSICGHSPWHTQMPSKIWRPSAGIVQYLELVHELLNSHDYTSPTIAAA